MSLTRLDFAGVEYADTQHVRCAIRSGDKFKGYIPSDALELIVRNHSALGR